MSGSAPGELSLSKLFSTLRVSVHPDTFVFLAFPSQPPTTLSSQMCFREKEGYTVISTLQSAKEHNLEGTFLCRMITCEVHSSLEAVGFMAALTQRLTERGIGANPVSGFYHDHLFVPAGCVEEAVKALEELADEAAMKSAWDVQTMFMDEDRYGFRKLHSLNHKLLEWSACRLLNISFSRWYSSMLVLSNFQMKYFIKLCKNRT